jgi:hypothetical protein
MSIEDTIKEIRKMLEAYDERASHLRADIPLVRGEAVIRQKMDELIQRKNIPPVIPNNSFIEKDEQRAQDRVIAALEWVLYKKETL